MANLLVDAVSGRHYGLSVNQSSAALVLGYLDVYLVGKFSVTSSLASYDPPLRALDSSAADYTAFTIESMAVGGRSMLTSRRRVRQVQKEF